MDRSLLSFLKSSIINTNIDEAEVDSKLLSDEEKVIEKLVIGDNLFKPVQAQGLSRDSRAKHKLLSREYFGHSLCLQCLRWF